MSIMNNKQRAYYAHFNTSILIAAKELLKSMPALYTRVYFSSKYLNALLNSADDEEFINVTILTEQENMTMMRNIIKTNSLYISDWDSLKYTDGEDFGFSFIAGNVKYVLLPFTETDTGYYIKSYDVDTNECYETNMSIDKKYFKDVALMDNGDFVRTADFNLEYINENNTRKFKAAKKDQPELIIVEDKRGYALTNMYILSVIAIACIFIVWLCIYIINHTS